MSKEHLRILEDDEFAFIAKYIAVIGMELISALNEDSDSGKTLRKYMSRCVIENFIYSFRDFQNHFIDAIYQKEEARKNGN